MALDWGHDHIDRDDSTDYMGPTPPESVAGDPSNHPRLDTSSSTFKPPRPGSTYIIKSLSDEHVGKAITLLEGQIVLSFPEGFGDAHWICVENNGWLGFRNVASGCYLGHNIHGWLLCTVSNHSGWERFHVRQRSEGGYVLLMTHWWDLRPVGFKQNKLAKIGNSSTVDDLAWEFVEVR